MKDKGIKKKILSVMVCVGMITALAGSAGVQMIKADPQAESNQTEKESQEIKQNSFTEEGTTTMGTISQMPEFALNRVLMYVEEVYVEAGSSVTEGDALFKIAEESMEDAKAYYENAISVAEDSLTEAKVAYESGELDASYIKLDAETTAANASATLETALADLQEDLEDKYEKWQETVYKIAAYNDNFYNDIYYTNSGIKEAEEALNTAQTAADNAQADYEACGVTYESAKGAFDAAVIELAAVTGGTSESGMTVEEAATAVVDSYQILSATEPLYEEMSRTKQELDKAKQKLEQVQSDYEKTVAQAVNSLEQLEASVDALQQNYETANREAETKRLELQKEYDTAVLEGEYAQTTYNETVEKLKSTVESAENTLEDLKEEQAALLALENGVVCANQSGTLASVTYDVEDILFSGTAFVTYYDTATLTISVEVEQENIAKIAVGDDVSVSISGNRRGNITGKVASVASSATTGRSVSDVTYAVIIAIENENNMLSAGSSATVTFEYGE